jgi:hypothetical protein
MRGTAMHAFCSDSTARNILIKTNSPLLSVPRRVKEEWNAAVKWEYHS